MAGIELAQAYFEEYGRPMLMEKFPEQMKRMAIGLVGHGSECYGYDDEISRDHDYEPGFCIWITDEDKEDFGFSLFRAYSKLPQEFWGISLKEKSVFGSNFKGVHTISEFYSFYTGTGECPQTNEEWLAIPDEYLAEATNGKVFLDELGEFSRIRNELKNCPLDVWKKKLASHLFNMAKSGQYNYKRCILHGEKVAAATSLMEFSKYTAKAVYAINHTYAPYTKWLYRGMRELPSLGELEGKLEELLISPYDYKKNEKLIEEICALVIATLREQDFGFCSSLDSVNFLEPYAYTIQDTISDGNLRNSPIML